MDWDDDTVRAAVMLDILSELKSRRRYCPQGIELSKLLSFLDKYDDPDFRSVVEELVQSDHPVRFSHGGGAPAICLERGGGYQDSFNQLVDAADW